MHLSMIFYNPRLLLQAKMDSLRSTQKQTDLSVSKLHERVNTVHSVSQRWYRSLQGHMIRLNNTLQDIAERLDNADRGAGPSDIMEVSDWSIQAEGRGLVMSWK